MLLVLAAGLWQAMARARIQWQAPGPVAPLLLLAMAGCLWAAFGGSGHLMYANSHDWRVRDALLADLVNAAWPPAYGGTEAEPVILRTALGYFLPAALLGKLAGLPLAHLALYAWTALGTTLFLLLLPLPRRIGARLVMLVATVVLFSGMDIIGQVLDKGWPKPAEHIEWWSVTFQYSSMTTQLFWVPNHCLPAWIATVLLYRHWQQPGFYPAAMLIAALLPAWTPFAAVGYAPFLALLMVDRLRHGHSLLPGAAVIAACALLVYLLGRLLTLDIAALPLDSPLSSVHDPARILERYLKFTLLEFALLALALLTLLCHSRVLLWLAFALLALLPLLRFGPSNDLLMRASIPALVVLLILTLRVLEEARFAGPSLLVGLMLAVGAVTPYNEFWRTVALPAWPPSLSASLADFARGGTIPNYFGRLDRADLKALLRPASPVRAP